MKKSQLPKFPDFKITVFFIESNGLNTGTPISSFLFIDPNLNLIKNQ